MKQPVPGVARCDSLEEVRAQIDRIDREMVSLLAERAAYVAQVVRFKRTVDDVRAPARVEQVIARVRQQAQETGTNPDLAEHVYRAMIGWFIEEELRQLGLEPHGMARSDEPST